jgi:hypothetical protein
VARLPPYAPLGALAASRRGSGSPPLTQPRTLGPRPRSRPPRSFAFDNPAQEAGLPVASCLVVKAPLQGPGDDKPKVVIRPYTPTSAPDAKG